MIKFNREEKMGAKIKGNQRTGQAGSLCVEGLGERSEEGGRQEESRECNRWRLVLPGIWASPEGSVTRKGLGKVVSLFDVL